MPRNRHRHSKSEFPISEPVSGRLAQSAPKQEVSLEEVVRLLDNSQFEQALELLDTAPKWMQREPEFGLVRATALMEYGDLDTAGDILREMERKNPKYMPLYLPLAAWYLAHEWPAHALRATRKALANKFDPEATEQAQALADGARHMIDFLAADLKVSFEKAEQASWYNEQAQLATLDANLVEVERMAKEAFKIAPHWTSPRNNRSHALFMLGKSAEAIAEAEAVVTNDPENVHGLSNLVMFHTGLGHTEPAAGYAKRLFELADKFDDDATEMDVIISALAIAEDSERLWELAQRFRRKPADILFSHSWHCLGIAAARLGHFKEAKKFLEFAVEDEESKLVSAVLEKVEKANRSKADKLLWPPMYPGLELLLSEKVIMEWADLAGKIEGEEPTPAQQKRIDAFYARHPYLLYLFKTMLWDEAATELGASALVILNKPEADAQVLRFAFSDVGDDNSRIQAALMLSKAGRYSPEGPVRFWNTGTGEWHDIELFSQEIGEVEYNIKPEVAELIGKSQRAKDSQEAIAFLRRAIEKDPNCAMALHNLGAFLNQQGQHAEGEALIRRSVEVDPTYTFGFANLGLMEAQRGNKEAALDLLTNVNKAKTVTPDTLAVANMAYAVLAMDEEDFERARRHFDMAREMKPNHPMLEAFEQRLQLAETLLGTGSFLRQYQEDSAHRFHKKALNTPLTVGMELKACLEHLTNETLVAMCQFWRIQSYGKKQAMVERLNARILDVEIFNEIIQGLAEQELEALKFILETGGWRSWKEFTAKFGDDFDESPWWKYHDPESIPGRLKLAGLIYAGTLKKQQVAFIPVDVRPLVKRLLN